MRLQGSLSIERMCQLAQVSRAGFYRSFREQEPQQEEMELRATIQQIFLEPSAALWLPAGEQRSATTRGDCQSQARTAVDAGR